MKKFAFALTAAALFSGALLADAAPAGASDCSKALRMGGAKAFFACIERDKH